MFWSICVMLQRSYYPNLAGLGYSSLLAGYFGIKTRLTLSLDNQHQASIFQGRAVWWALSLIGGDVQGLDASQAYVGWCRAGVALFLRGIYRVHWQWGSYPPEKWQLFPILWLLPRFPGGNKSHVPLKTKWNYCLQVSAVVSRALIVLFIFSCWYSLQRRKMAARPQTAYRAQPSIRFASSISRRACESLRAMETRARLSPG